MTFNPFTAKPQADHERIIRHFMHDAREIIAFQRELLKDIDDFMQTQVEMKEELRNFAPDFEKSKTKEKREAIQYYKNQIQENTLSVEDFRTDIAHNGADIEEQITKVQGSKDKMTKAERARFNTLVDMQPMVAKMNRKMKAIEGEILACTKIVEKFEASMNQQ